MYTGNQTDDLDQLRAENAMLRAFLRRVLVVLGDEVYRPEMSASTMAPVRGPQTHAPPHGRHPVGLVDAGS